MKKRRFTQNMVQNLKWCDLLTMLVRAFVYMWQPQPITALWSPSFIIDEDRSCMWKPIHALMCNRIRKAACGDRPLSILCLLVFGWKFHVDNNHRENISLNQTHIFYIWQHCRGFLENNMPFKVLKNNNLNIFCANFKKRSWRKRVVV